MKLYGLKVCDTCRKARQEIEKAGKSVEFIDVRDTPLTAAQISGFIAEFGEALDNLAWSRRNGAKRVPRSSFGGASHVDEAPSYRC